MREVAVALHSLGQTLADVKQAFPGAEVSEVRRKDDVVDIEDSLPF